MALRTMAMLAILSAALIAAPFAPIWGLCGYVLHYSVGPERQWWGAPLRHLDLRLSLTLAGVTALGFLAQYPKLKFGRSALMLQEKLLLVFLGLVWLSSALGEPTVGAYTTVDHPTLKMAKIAVIVFLLTHIVTRLKDLDLLLWTLTLAGLWLGLDAYQVPYGAFVKGRLESIGGPDFAESNFLAAYAATLLPLIGVLFLRTKLWGKFLCLASGVFLTNLVILTRSRGVVVGLALGGVVAILLTPRWVRWKIRAGLVVALLGGLYLADPQFLHRTSTIVNSEEERDPSVQNRIILNRLGMQMFRDHPFGIGAGNFFQTIGRYAPALEGRDAHNTYLRCTTELGVQGGAVFLLLIINAFAVVRRVWKHAAQLPEECRQTFHYLCYALAVSMTVLLGCCATISLTYVEYLWWFLALPVCLERAVQNTAEELAPEAFDREAGCSDDDLIPDDLEPSTCHPT